MDNVKSNPTYSLEYISYYPYTKRRTELVNNVLHTHTFWEIPIVFCGQIANVVNKNKIIMKYGDICILRPQDAHYLTLDSEVIDYRDVYVPVDIMKRACDVIAPDLYEQLMTRDNPEFFKLNPTHLDSLEYTVSQLDDVKFRSEEYDEVLFSVVLRLLFFYREKQRALLSETKQKTPQWFSHILRQIDENPISVVYDDIVKMFGYSKSHVCKLFKKYMGCSLTEYMVNAKLHYSTGLLLNREFTILQISSVLGYSNQSNYVNAFKAKYGMSPSEWRKTNAIYKQ